MSEELKSSLTIQDIQATILTAQYHVFPGTTVTVCCLTLKNGAGVIGYSGCIDPNRFDPVKGQKSALDNAIEKIWELEGYLLRNQRYLQRVYQD